MVTAKILEVDTSKTTLKVKLLTEKGDTIECWVLDQLVNKIMLDTIYTTSYNEYQITESVGHKWIEGITKKS